MSANHLIGGGRDAASLYQRFIADCPAERPRIATVLIDEGDGANDVVRFVDALRDAGDCEAFPILIQIGETFDPTILDAADGLFVCGGLTPAYADSIAPVAASVRDWLAVDGHVYGGFSAGAAIAACRAVVGGWLLDGVPICHEDTGEDLDELSVVDGLDLVPFAVDVHCGTWGTLTRLSAAVESGAVIAGVGIDENTMLSVDGESATVSGVGRVWVVTRGERSLMTQLLTAGERFNVSALSP
jgi:cyanophycinase